MKKILGLLLLSLFCLSLKAQPPQKIGGVVGLDMKRAVVRDTFFLPTYSDTPFVPLSPLVGWPQGGRLAMVIRGGDTSLWFHTGYRWKITGSNTGSSLDTTSLSNRINLKLNISDTATKTWDWGDITGKPLMDLQWVTDNGATTTNNITISSSNASFNVENTTPEIFAGFEADNSEARVNIGVSAGHVLRLKGGLITADRIINFPNKSGTLPLSIRLNGTTYTSNDTGSIELGTIGGSTDTASLSNRINNNYSSIAILPDSAGFILQKPNGLKDTVTIDLTSALGGSNSDSTSARLIRGTYAQRPSASDTGAVYYQTDALDGIYVADGTNWVYQQQGSLRYNLSFTDGSTGFVGVTFSSNGGGATRISSVDGLGSGMDVNTGSSSASGSGGMAMLAGTRNVGKDDSVYVTYTIAYVGFPNLSDNTNRFIARTGINGGGASTYGGMGGELMFTYCDSINSGQWFIRASDNGNNPTVYNSSVTVSEKKLYRLLIKTDWRNTTHYCYINNELIASVPFSQVQAPLVSALGTQVNSIVKTKGTTYRTFLVREISQHVKYKHQ